MNGLRNRLATVLLTPPNAHPGRGTACRARTDNPVIPAFRLRPWATAGQVAGVTILLVLPFVGLARTVSAQSPSTSVTQGTPPPTLPQQPASQQIAPQQIAPQPPPSFQTQTITIEVDVIVKDKSGKFVTGLQPGDFEITEDGLGQTFHSMYFVQGRTATPDLMRPGGTAPATRQGAEGQPTGAAIGAPSSHTAAPPRVFVLFFDQDHMDGNDFKRLQDAAEKFLTTEFETGDVGGVLVGATMADNRLSTDREALLQAVRNAKYSGAQTSRKLDEMDWPRIMEPEAIRIALANDKDVLAQVVRRAGADGAQGGGRASPDLEPLVRQKARQMVSTLQPPAAQTVRTLLALVNGLARLPGRKTVIFLTDGFYVEESWGQLRNIVAIAARSNVRVYAIDAQGLQRRSNYTDPSQNNPLDTGATIPLDAYNTVEEGPNTLAVDTGGYVIRYSNDFSSALKEIAADTSTYYVLGYSPINTKFDGKFRSISVKVKRPGVSVRARKGYVATTPSTAPAPDARPAPAAEPPADPKATPPSAPAVVPRPDAAAAGEPVPSLTLPLERIALRPDGAARVRNLASTSMDSAASKSLASRGWDRYTKGDLEGAEPLLAKAAGLPGAAPWVSYALGFAEAGLKRPAEAVRSWERVRAEAPQFEPVYLDLADVYLQVNDPDRAISTLRAADERWPGDVDVLNALGTVQVTRGAHADAIATFQKAIAAKPGDGLAYFNIARTYELRYYALRRFSRPNARWIDNPDLLTKARENYEAYVRLGGPFLIEAQAALTRILSR